MIEQPCGLKLGTRNARVKLIVLEPAQLGANEKVVAELYLADATSGDVLCLHSSVELTEAARTGYLIVQGTTKPNQIQIGYGSGSVARLLVKFRLVTVAAAKVAATLQINDNTADPLFETARQESDTTTPIFWTVTN